MNAPDTLDSTDASVPVVPGRLPLLGHTIPLMRRRIGFLQEVREFGDMVTLYLGTERVYVLNSPDLIRRVLVDDAAKFERGKIFDKLGQVSGKGLITSNGTLHHRQRRIMQPAFAQHRIVEYAQIMRDTATAFAEKLRPGEQIALDKEMTELAVTITAKALFRTDLGESAVNEIRQSMPILAAGIMLRTAMPGNWFERLPLPANRRYEQARGRMTGMVDEVVGVYQSDGVDRGDLLSMLVAARYEDTGEPMTTDQIRDEIMAILIAGTETTAVTLSWLFHELARNPETEQRVHEELDTVLGGRPAELADFGKLTFCDRVLNEVIRLHSPIWLLMRRATEPVRLGEITLTPGTEVMLSMSTMHRDEGLYPDPLRFDPDRWADGKHSVLSPRCAFIPFGAGRHKCVGDNFAWTELLIAMAALCSRWRFRPVPGADVHEVALSTLRPNHLPMTAQPRQAA
jgi:cytochrome P450